MLPGKTLKTLMLDFRYQDFRFQIQSGANSPVAFEGIAAIEVEIANATDYAHIDGVVRVRRTRPIRPKSAKLGHPFVSISPLEVGVGPTDLIGVRMRCITQLSGGRYKYVIVCVVGCAIWPLSVRQCGCKHGVY